MSKDKEEQFIKLIQDNSKIIHKIIGLYSEDDSMKKDMEQEILLQSWKSFESFRGNSSFGTWLYKLAINTVFTFNRKSRKTKFVEIDKSADRATEGKQNDNSELLYLIIKKLEDVDKLIMTMHLDGFSNIEIAEFVGIKSNHLNVKIHRLKNLIIEEFKKLSDGYTK